MRVPTMNLSIPGIRNSIADIFENGEHSAYLRKQYQEYAFVRQSGFGVATAVVEQFIQSIRCNADANDVTIEAAALQFRIRFAVHSQVGGVGWLAPFNNL